MVNTSTVQRVWAQERGCSFINAKEQHRVTEWQAQMLTHKDRQIHTIHPAETAAQSLSIRDGRMSGSWVFSESLRAAGAAKSAPGSRITFVTSQPFFFTSDYSAKSGDRNAMLCPNKNKMSSPCKAVVSAPKMCKATKC